MSDCRREKNEYATETNGVKNIFERNITKNVPILYIPRSFKPKNDPRIMESPQVINHAAIPSAATHFEKCNISFAAPISKSNFGFQLKTIQHKKNCTIEPDNVPITIDHTPNP